MSSDVLLMHSHHRDDEGSKIGMWLFLFTELILFGGLFLVYAVYRFKHPDEFKLASADLNTVVGTINTIVLLTSSLTVVLALQAIQESKKWLTLFFLLLTEILGAVFMINKYFEWGHKIHAGIYPQSPVLLERSSGEILYFGLYYVMTGLHALHVIIGMLILAVMMLFIYKGSINQSNFIRLEIGALYWHLVDIIWIFLFPLFYLIH